MWLFTEYGFFSVTRPTESSGIASGQLLQVRARDSKHLLNLQAAFPEELGKVHVIELPNRDYRYRFYLNQKSWAIIQAKLAQQIDYSNFKNRCHAIEQKVGAAYINSLVAVWGVMHALQTSPQKSAPPVRSEGVNLISDPIAYDVVGRRIPDTVRERWLQQLAVQIDPRLGTWNLDGDIQRSSDPYRLSMLPSVPEWGGEELTGYLRACGGELDVAGILLLGADIAYSLLIANRKSIPDFLRARKLILNVRRFAYRWDEAGEMLEAANELALLNPEEGDPPHARFVPYRAVYRAVLNAAIVASRLLHDGDSWKLLEQKIPLGYSVDFISDADFYPPHLLGLLARRLGQMGRRYNESALVHLVDDRVQWAAINRSFKDAGNPWLNPHGLGIGTQEAASFIQNKNITPAMRIDGAGSFQFSAGQHFKSANGNDRRVQGFGFTTDGEAVYIVWAAEENRMVAKRAWKAHREYKPNPPYEQVALVQRPPGTVSWGSLRAE